MDKSEPSVQRTASHDQITSQINNLRKSKQMNLASKFYNLSYSKTYLHTFYVTVKHNLLQIA